jgi:broad specificity phosphatase PhoE
MRRRCYLVRHGQTRWNLENRIQGHSDIPLDDHGKAQARRAAQALASIQAGAIFTSWLARSRQTAEAISAAQPHQPELTIQPDLAEIHLGDWEGLTPAAIEANCPGAYSRWKDSPSLVPIPNSEPLDAFKLRVRAAMESVLAAPEPGDCVVVTHGGVIAALLSHLLQADFDHVMRRLRLDNASITAVEFGGRFPHVLWINSTLHLSDLEAVSPQAQESF